MISGDVNKTGEMMFEYWNHGLTTRIQVGFYLNFQGDHNSIQICIRILNQTRFFCLDTIQDMGTASRITTP